MFERDVVKGKLTEYIIREFDIEEDDDEFDEDIHLFDYGYIDSFGAVKLIDFIEEALGVEITNKDLIMYPMNTINEIVEVIEMKGE